MKKILVVGMSDNIGGIETYFHNYYRYIDKEKYQFDFVTVCDTIAFADEYKENGSKIISLPSFIKHPIRYYNEMRKIIRDNKYDVVHINMLSAANVLPVKAALAEKVPKVIVHSHNTDVPKGLIRKTLHGINKRLLVKPELTRLACSKMAGEWLFGSDSDFTVINDGIEIDKFSFDLNSRKEIRKKYNIGDSDFLIGNVGRICEQKNQTFLVDVLKKIENKNIKLMMVGDGDKKKIIVDKIRDYGLENRVVIVPTVLDVEKYYNAFDLFVLTSRFEGFGMVAVEAQANGLTCVLPDYLKETEIFSNQICLKINDAEIWAEAIDSFFASNDKTRKDYSEHIKACGFDPLREYKVFCGVYDG